MAVFLWLGCRIGFLSTVNFVQIQLFFEDVLKREVRLDEAERVDVTIGEPFNISILRHILSEVRLFFGDVLDVIEAVEAEAYADGIVKKNKVENGIDLFKGRIEAIQIKGEDEVRVFVILVSKTCRVT